MPGTTDETPDQGTVTEELSIICVNWNSLNYLVECVASIYKNTEGISFEIIVVDNASPEGGIDKLKDQFPQVTVIKSDRNLGFAGANNLGFRHSSGQYILLLNPDTEVIGPAIATMLAAIKSLPDAGIVGCKLLDSDLTISTTSIQKFPTIINQLLGVEWLRLRFPSLPLWNIAPLFSESHAAVKVEVIPGACMMLRRDVFQRVGLLTEDYFMYAEDIDLNFKTGNIGLSSYYIGDAQIIHQGGKSSDKQMASQWSTVMKNRALLRFFSISRGNLYARAFQAMMGISAAARLVLLALASPFASKGRIQWASAKWRAILKWSLGLERVEAS
jgi:GT2 family glycosyltransferase